MRLRTARPFLILAIALALGASGLLFLFLRSPGAAIPTTPIEHVIVIMKENHAFDNYFGTFPGVDGIPADATLPDGRGGIVRPHWLSGPSTPDLPHGRAEMIEDYHGGRNDGFAEAAERWGPGLGNYSVGYYDARQIPGYWELAGRFVLADRYFHSMFGPTIPNRLYSLAGQSGGLLSNDLPAGGIDIPTIFDQLEGKGVPWRYYYFAVDGYAPLPFHFPRLSSNPAMKAKVTPMDGLLTDIRAGALPAVTYVDPIGGFGISEHPPENVTRGEDWTIGIIDAIMAGPQWPASAILVTWDESGGYYDHVPPPQVDEMGYGFRVPLLVISPFAKRGWIDHYVMDHSSILKLIARNWRFPDLTSREAGAHDMLSAFDFGATQNLSYGSEASFLASQGPSSLPPLKFEHRVLAEAIPRKFPSQRGVKPF